MHEYSRRVQEFLTQFSRDLESGNSRDIVDIWMSWDSEDEQDELLVGLLENKISQMVKQNDCLPTCIELATRYESISDEIIRVYDQLSDQQKLPQRLGKFAVAKVVGSGAAGTTAMGFSMANPGCFVKLKFVDRLKYPELAEAIRDEADALNSLKHSHIPKLLGSNDHKNFTFIATDYVEGESLQTIAKARQLRYREFLRIARDLASALSYLHAGNIYHGDVKPDNVLVSNDGQAFLIDFGTSQKRRTKTEDNSPKPRTDHSGTAEYSPPEQLLRSPDSDGRVSDIFNFGASIGAVILRGAHPGKTPKSRADFLNAVEESDASILLKQIVARTCTDDPAARAGSIDDIYRQLNAELEKFDRRKQLLVLGKFLAPVSIGIVLVFWLLIKAFPDRSNPFVRGPDEIPTWVDELAQEQNVDFESYSKEDFKIGFEFVYKRNTPGDIFHRETLKPRFAFQCIRPQVDIPLQRMYRVAPSPWAYAETSDYERSKSSPWLGKLHAPLSLSDLDRDGDFGFGLAVDNPWGERSWVVGPFSYDINLRECLHSSLDTFLAAQCLGVEPERIPVFEVSEKNYGVSDRYPGKTWQADRNRLCKYRLAINKIEFGIEKNRLDRSVSFAFLEMQKPRYNMVDFHSVCNVYDELDRLVSPFRDSINIHYRITLNDGRKSPVLRANWYGKKDLGSIKATVDEFFSQSKNSPASFRNVSTGEYVVGGGHLVPSGLGRFARHLKRIDYGASIDQLSYTVSVTHSEDTPVHVSPDQPVLKFLHFHRDNPANYLPAPAHWASVFIVATFKDGTKTAPLKVRNENPAAGVAIPPVNEHGETLTGRPKLHVYRSVGNSVILYFDNKHVPFENVVWSEFDFKTENGVVFGCSQPGAILGKKITVRFTFRFGDERSATYQLPKELNERR